MPAKAKPIPQGFHTATPYLTVNDAAGAIDFYKRAFGAKERMRMDAPVGKIGHAEVQIGDAIVMLCDEMPMSNSKSPKTLGGTASAVFLYVDDVDAVYKQAVSAGATGTGEPTDMFWGDRFGHVLDPYGHSWALATHIEDVAPQEMARRHQEHTQKMMEQQKTRHAG